MDIYFNEEKQRWTHTPNMKRDKFLIYRRSLSANHPTWFEIPNYIRQLEHQIPDIRKKHGHECKVPTSNIRYHSMLPVCRIVDAHEKPFVYGYDIRINQWIWLHNEMDLRITLEQMMFYCIDIHDWILLNTVHKLLVEETYQETRPPSKLECIFLFGDTHLFRIYMYLSDTITSKLPRLIQLAQDRFPRNYLRPVQLKQIDTTRLYVWESSNTKDSYLFADDNHPPF